LLVALRPAWLAPEITLPVKREVTFLKLLSQRGC
jgi:hypothetical protein